MCKLLVGFSREKLRGLYISSAAPKNRLSGRCLKCRCLKCIRSRGSYQRYEGKGLDELSQEGMDKEGGAAWLRNGSGEGGWRPFGGSLVGSDRWNQRSPPRCLQPRVHMRDSKHTECTPFSPNMSKHFTFLGMKTTVRNTTVRQGRCAYTR